MDKPLVDMLLRFGVPLNDWGKYEWEYYETKENKSMIDPVEEKRKDYIRQIRAVGETLIKNAESLVGSEKTIYGMHITVDMKDGRYPTMNVSKDIYPENY